MNNIYLLPGLGNDERVFRYLDFAGMEVVYLPWLMPLPAERIEQYAGRMAEKIMHPNPIIIGLSFGGMMAIEIAKNIAVKKIVLISSAKGKAEIPFYLRWLGKTGLQHVLPTTWFLRANAFTYWLFGLKEKEHKQLLKDVFNATNHQLYRWSGNAILTWQNAEQPTQIVHIHGTTDRILPYRFVTATHTIHGGGHFMLVTHAVAVSALLQVLVQDEKELGIKK